MIFPELQLPPFDHRLKEENGKTFIFDSLRKKFVVLTPEEWVRQHFISMLLVQFKYPKGLFNVEKSLHYHRLSKRSDILVFNTSSQPYLLVECKAAHIPMDKLVVQQASLYNRSVQAPFFCITNGIRTFCFEVDWERQATKQMKELPGAPK